MEVVRSPESAGPKKGPGDLSVGPSIWKEGSVLILLTEGAKNLRRSHRNQKYEGEAQEQQQERKNKFKGAPKVQVSQEEKDKEVQEV